jgi:hypothetical protein
LPTLAALSGLDDQANRLARLERTESRKADPPLVKCASALQFDLEIGLDSSTPTCRA